MDEDQRTREIARVVIHEFFETVGVDTTTQDGRKKFRDNLEWVQSLREGTASAKTAALGAAVVSLLGVVGWMFLQGIKAVLVSLRAV